ncbi:hypothetical protein M0R45_019102 [Rubus argutus]|uniref:Uncharacterized protein n=1 Tax=Rubus argutus TaxID=59490 RepID=A0AAW1X751_RUBAR
MTCAVSTTITARFVFLGLLGSSSRPIQIWKAGDCVEQLSTDIWHAISAAGPGFVATCSLVAADADGYPVTVSWIGDLRRNIIYCGGALSPEMQPPKILWVKEDLPESWSMVLRWMNLSDWLSYSHTGDDTYILCTTVCKWTYLGHAHM